LRRRAVIAVVEESLAEVFWVGEDFRGQGEFAVL
jgi:hypothetical protein